MAGTAPEGFECLPQRRKTFLNILVILWSRMGTPLPAEYAKSDETAYLSGTEWVYQDATTAAGRPGRPVVRGY